MNAEDTPTTFDTVPPHLQKAVPSHATPASIGTAVVNPIMKYFRYKHLPMNLQVVSSSLCEIAQTMDSSLPDGPEKSAGMRKLLEAKDCFVRASL